MKRKGVETVKEEIGRAVKTLGLSWEDISELPSEEGRSIFDWALDEFVGGDSQRWWWESFIYSSTAIKFANGLGFRKLSQIVSDDREPVFLIAEDIQLPFYPVYETSTVIVEAVIAECYSFEYYLISKDGSWLLCETHHKDLIGIGQPVEQKLAAMKSHRRNR